MTIRIRSLFLRLGALLVAFAAAGAAIAAPSGNLSISTVATGVVNIHATRIDFALPANPPAGAAGVGDFATGGNTTIPYSGGVVTAATNGYGQLKDLDLGAGVVVDFIRFYVSPTPPVPSGSGTLQVYPAFDLTALTPGGSAQGALNDCAGVTAVGVACSPLITTPGGPVVSPLVLTNRGAYTGIALGAALLGRDANGSVPWTGGFSMQVVRQGAFAETETILTPAAIQTLLNNGGSISSAFSATFTAVVPVADAGPDQNVTVTNVVQLDGSGSSDPGGAPLTYAWTLTQKPPGSIATLNNPTAVNPTFTADVPGAYTAQLIVNNGTTNSAPDTVSITAAVLPPVAEAGMDQTVIPGTLVQLSGAGSSDPNGLPLTYAWTLTRPPGSNAALSSTTAVNPTFVPDVLGQYVAQLIVNNGFLSSAPDTVTIAAQVSPPVAIAGPDQSPTLGAPVQLNGSASFDPNGLPLTYAWTLTLKPPGSNSTLSNPVAVNPTFTPDLPGTYTAQLIVNNGFLSSAPDSVTINVAAIPPVANAGPDQQLLAGSLVALNGGGSSDPNQLPLTFLWSFVSIPLGSSAIISNPTAVTPTFVADVPGNYVVQLVVNNGFLSSAADTVLISAAAPVVDIPTLDGYGLALLVVLLAALAARARRRTNRWT